MTNTNISGKHFVLGITGGIAAYKAAELCRLLVKAGAHVQVVMTPSGARFITPMTMQALSGQAVFASTWADQTAGGIANGMAHINLTRTPQGRCVDAVIVAPASADFMAKLSHGHADELLSLLCLARPAGVPLLLAPAMNREMWTNPATQRNVAQLQADGVTVLAVGQGDQACGEVGEGRMLEPKEILEDISAFLTPKLLLGKQVLITAGATYEAIDPVRGITNLSSGKMGYAIAQAARHAGAAVTLVTGRTALPLPRYVQSIMVNSALEMWAAVEEHMANADVFIATAAVADWRPEHASHSKIKKEMAGDPPTLKLVRNLDILASVAATKRARSKALYCVGFAAETENLLEHTRTKQRRKNVPLMVGNIGPATFGQDENALLLVDEGAVIELARSSKRELAQQLIQEIAKRTGTPPLA